MALKSYSEIIRNSCPKEQTIEVRKKNWVKFYNPTTETVFDSFFGEKARNNDERLS